MGHFSLAFATWSCESPISFKLSPLLSIAIFIKTKSKTIEISVDFATCKHTDPSTETFFLKIDLFQFLRQIQ